MYRATTFALLSLATLATAHAESLAPLTGRTFGPDDTEALSIDIGYVTSSDFKYPTARVNSRINDRLQVYGNFSQVEVDIEISDLDTDGNVYGGGVFYKLPDFSYLPEYDVAVQASFTTGTAESEAFTATLQGGGQVSGKFELDTTVLALGLVASSPVPLAENGLQWYAGIGVEKIDTDLKVVPGNAAVPNASNSETEPTAQGGVVLPLGFGSAYAGFHYSDEVFYGAGIRYVFE